MTPGQIKETYIQRFTKHASDIVVDGLKEVGLPESALTSITTTLVKSYTLGWNDREEYIPLSRAKPPYEKPVLVKRYNQFSNKTDILIGHLHKAEVSGRSYGKLGLGGLTYDDYWSLPSVQLLDHVSEWMFIPGYDYTDK